MSTQHAYVCDGCHETIGHNERVKVSSRIEGYLFFHATKNCEAVYNQRLLREAVRQRRYAEAWSPHD